MFVQYETTFSCQAAHLTDKIGTKSATEAEHPLRRPASPLLILESEIERPRKQIKIEDIPESVSENVEEDEDAELSFDPGVFPELARDHAKEVDTRMNGTPYSLNKHGPTRVLIPDLPQFLLAGKLCNNIVETVSASLSNLPHQTHVLRVLNEAFLHPLSAEKLVGLQGVSGAGQVSSINHTKIY